MSERIIAKIRERLPVMAAAADQGSRKAAIRLFCLECVGGQPSEVVRCTVAICPLYRFRLGRFLREGGADCENAEGIDGETTDDGDDEPGGGQDEPGA